MSNFRLCKIPTSDPPGTLIPPPPPPSIKHPRISTRNFFIAMSAKSKISKSLTDWLINRFHNKMYFNRKICVKVVHF